MTLSLTGDVFYISPYFYSCFVALREKALAFDVKTLALYAREQDAGDYKSRTLTGRIPSLTHNEITIAESSAILEYLEEAFPATARVLPTNTVDKARARQTMSWIRSDDTLPIRDERSTHTMFYVPTDKPLSENAKKSVAKLFSITSALLAGNGKTAFAEWSIVDAELALMLQRLIRNGDAVPDALRAYAEAQWERPSVREFLVRERPEYVPY